MTRPAAPSDFPVEVEGIGNFVFGRRTGRDRFKIAAEYHRLTEGLDVSNTDFGITAEAQTTVTVLLVDGPDEIKAMLDLGAAASLDPEADAKLLRVFFALRAKELSFRRPAGEGVKAPGPENGDVAGVLVPKEIPARAD